MAEPFLGQITMFGGNFAPLGWAFCHGQLLAISQNSALFSILGTTFGGDGQTTFGLPELRGRVPVCPGTGPGLTAVNLGQKAGVETTTLTQQNLPSHTHELDVKLKASSDRAREKEPADNSLAEGRDDMYKSAAPDVDMHSGSIDGTIGNTGGDPNNNNSTVPFDNRPPFLGINFIIALSGVFPSQS